MDTQDSPCLYPHNHISNSAILNNICFVAKWFVCMRTNFENGVANEAIVVQAGALLSERVTQFWTNLSEEEEER